MSADSYKNSFVAQESGNAALSVHNVGHQLCECGYKWGPGVRDHYLIHHVVSGRGSYIADGVLYRIESGDTFIVYPGVTVSYQADEDDPWEYYWIGFNGSEAARLLRCTDFSRGRLVLSTDFGTRLRDILLEIYNERGSRPFEMALMCSGLYRFLSCLMENAQHTVSRSVIGDQCVQCACEFMRSNFSHRISADDIARSVGASRSGLYREFIRQMSMSPKQYLTRVRMEQASALLLESELTIEMVAFSVGYDDPLYFSRAFKQYTGCSPREFARKHSK